MNDVIIVGARCAGSPTAMLLARKGYKVLLLDKASFPSDVVSAHFIHYRGIARLSRWGLLDKVAASNCPPITEFKVDLGIGLTLDVSYNSRTVRINNDVVAELNLGPNKVLSYCPRRRILDQILVDAAVESGAALRELVTVLAVIRADDRVTGVRCRTSSGKFFNESARIVIGADGLHSIVAKGVNTSTYDEVQSLTCSYHGYWSDVPVGGLEFYPRHRRAIFAVPTNDNLTLIGVGWPRSEYEANRGDVQGNFQRSLDLVPSLVERVCEGKQVERIVGAIALPGYFRKPYGPGWALVGDAGYHRDPVTGQGISDAFRDAELVADAVDAVLGFHISEEEAFAEYEQRRNALALPLYRITCTLAALERPGPHLIGMFAALNKMSDTDLY